MPNRLSKKRVIDEFDEDIYSEDYIEVLEEDDEMAAWELAFMRGYIGIEG